MYQFVSGFINITDLNIHVEWQVCTTLLVCISSYFCLYFNNWLTFNSEASNMIIILEFPNGKNVN